MGSHPWGVFVSDGEKLEPIYIFRSGPGEGDDAELTDFGAYLVAALDLDFDGNDELIIRAGYYEGSGYKILSYRDGVYREVLTSYYRGL